MDKNNNLLNSDDLADILAQLSELDDPVPILDDEELASQRRYEEIIKKHKHDE